MFCLQRTSREKPPRWTRKPSDLRSLRGSRALGRPALHKVSYDPEELAVAVGQVVERYDSADGRPYRMVALGHPSPVVTEGGSDE